MPIYCSPLLPKTHCAFPMTPIVEKPLSTPPTPPIPPEIIDACLSHITTDKPTLRSCSLVCRAWVHPTRRYLYHSWTISAFAWDRFYKSLLLLAHPQCTFASSIRHLSIIDKYASQSTYSSFDWDGVLSLVLPHVHKLTSLRSLDLSNFYLITTSDAWGALLSVSQFAGISELQLRNDNPTYYSFDLVTKVVSSFPLLQTLKYHLACSAGDSIAAPLSPPALRNLEVDFSLSRRFIGVDVPGTACLLSPYKADLGSINAYIARLGRSLTRLHVEFDADTEGAADAETFFKLVNLHNTPRLQSLTIKGVLSWEIPKGTMSPYDLSGALNALSGAPVRVITLLIPTTFGKRGAPPQRKTTREEVWSEIDDVLMRGFPELRRVQFRGWSEVLGFVREKLPCCSREGLVGFVEVANA